MKRRLLNHIGGLLEIFFGFLLGKNLWPQKKFIPFSFTKTKYFTFFERYLKRNSCVGGHNAGISFHWSVIFKKFAKEVSN